MKKWFCIIVSLPAVFLLSCNKILIQETLYEGRPHFKVKTRTATYFLDKAGGGLSRVIDPDGTDWVCYNGSADATAPSGAGGGFRGIPNLVFRSDDGGAGHPGFNKCTSEKVNGQTIQTKSKSGKWAWNWKFYDDGAKLTVEKADAHHPYWFLYEGPVAGSFAPHRKYWGTDLGGPRQETPSLNEGEAVSGNWQWAYFGDKGTDRVFFVAQHQKDTLDDHFAYMGSTREGNLAEDGMVVFGFGRKKGARPLMTAENASFSFGFIDRKIVSEKDHLRIVSEISDRINNHAGH